MARRHTAVTLASDLGLGPRELVAIVGAGGKSTLLHALGRDFDGSATRVVLTTTTRVSPDQLRDPVAWTADPAVIDRLAEPGVPLFVALRRERHKIIGISPDDADRIFADTDVDQVIVEADGARRMSLKAPADHEPAIPSSATVVVVVVGADAVGGSAEEVAHRPEIVARIAGVGISETLTVDHVARVLLDPNGGLKRVPDEARVVMAITRADAAADGTVPALASLLGSHPRVGRVLTLGMPA